MGIDRFFGIGNTALVAIRSELAKLTPDAARIQKLMPHVKKGTMDKATYDKVVALYAVDFTAQQPATLPTAEPLAPGCSNDPALLNNLPTNCPE